MPLSAKGKKILAHMIEEYGSEEKAKQVFYASKKAGTITGVDSMTESQTDLFKEVTDNKPDTVEMNDALVLDDDAQVRITSDGYLTAMPRIARTGIQQYRGSECGRPDVDIVRVYRPRDSVFATDSIRSLAHRPITIEHPPVRVTADNWKKYAVGHTGDQVVKDETGNVLSVRVPMVLMDSAAIDAVKEGKRELSVGYTCNLDWASGVTDSGEQYDAVQRDIRANHLAVVATARGGPTLKIGDGEAKEIVMELKTVVVDGINVQMSDTAAQVVQRTIEKLQDQAENFKKKKAEEDDEKEKKAKKDSDALADLKKQVDAKDAENIALKQQLEDNKLTPEKLAKSSREFTDAVSKARVILKDRLIVDGKLTPDIKKQLVEAKLGDQAKDWDENRIDAAFLSFTADIKGDPIKKAADAFSRPHFGDNGGEDPRKTAYMEMVRDMSSGRTPKSA